MHNLLKTPHHMLMEDAGVAPRTPGMLKTPKQALLEEMGIPPKMAEGGLTTRQMEAELMSNGRDIPKFTFAKDGSVNATFTPEQFSILKPKLVELGMIQ
jgi:hypothetical protein